MSSIRETAERIANGQTDRCPTCSHGQGVDAEGRCLFRFVAADPSQVVDTSPATQCRCFCPRTVGEQIVRAYFVFADYDKPLFEPGQQLAATIDQALRNERERAAKIADEWIGVPGIQNRAFVARRIAAAIRKDD